MLAHAPIGVVRSAGIAFAFVLLGCSNSPVAKDLASTEPVATSTERIIVTPTAPEHARNRAAGANFNSRTYVAWVGTDDQRHVNVASTPACPFDMMWKQGYEKTPFPGERGSDDAKAGGAMAASPAG